MVGGDYGTEPGDSQVCGWNHVVDMVGNRVAEASGKVHNNKRQSLSLEKYLTEAWNPTTS